MADGQPNVLDSIAELPGYSSSARAARREYHDVQLMSRTNAAIIMACETATITLTGSR
jgi:hypothetical protein